MPRVGYTIPMQGFRPKTNPGAAMAGIGLRGMGSQAMPMALATNGAPEPSSCSYWDFFFDKPAWDACQNALAVAQIQNVPQKAAAAGYSPTVVQVAQQEADLQSAQVPGDTTSIADYYGAGQLLYTPQTQTALPTWAWVGLAFGVFLLVKN